MRRVTCRLRILRNQQRDVVVALRFRNEELDRHRLQERRIRSRHVTRRIVVTDFETQLIMADRDRTTADERPVGAAVVVCYSLDDRAAGTLGAKLGERPGPAPRPYRAI